MLDIIGKMLALLTLQEKRNLAIVGGFMIFNALVEVLGIAIVAPLLAIMVAPDTLQSFPFLPQIYTALGFTDFTTFSIFLGLIIFFVILFNNSISIATNYLSFRYAHNREYTIGWSLLKTYLHQPYRFFLERNSIELLRNVDNEVAYIISNILNQLLVLGAKIISALAILAFIFMVHPQVTLVISLILGVAYLFVYMLTKKKLFYIGRERMELSHIKLKLISDSIRIFKDIKMMNAEKMFLDKFEDACLKYARIRTWSEIVSISPRYLIEICAISALVFAVIYLVSNAENPATTLPVLGIYAFAGYRLMPSLQQIYNALSKIQLSIHSLDTIFNEFKNLQAEAEINIQRMSSRLPMNRFFGLRNVFFSYDGKIPILDDVSLTISKGQKIGIVGRSGSGKSTIIDLLVGLNSPNSGELVVDDVLLTPNDLPGWRSNIGYVSQNVYLLDDTIDVNITLESRPELIDLSLLREVRRLALIDEFATEEESSVGEDGSRLSGGQRQRIGIARALYRHTDILVFDEATSALDVETERRILQNLIQYADRTMIFITHRVETLNFCDEIYLISEGKIRARGSFGELAENSEPFMKLMKTFDSH